jgi:hypothetical protein
MKKYNKLSLTTGVVLGAIVTIAGVSFAAGDFNQDVKGEMRFQGQSHKTMNPEIKSAFESKDYEAFKLAAGEKRAEKITQEIFEKMIQMHDAKESGDDEKVSEIKSELKELGFKKHGKGYRGHGDKHEKKPEVKQAIEDGNYEAFKNAIGEKKSEKITQEIFSKIQEMHDAKESGDREKMSEIRNELKSLGFEGHKKRSHR